MVRPRTTNRHETRKQSGRRLPRTPNTRTHHHHIPHKRKLCRTHAMHPPNPHHRTQIPRGAMNPLKRLAPNQHNQTNPNATHTTETPPTPNPNWRTQAACQGKTPQMFPKNYKDITYIPAARALCRTCPVRTECLEYALGFPAADMHGVWAGLTPRQLAAEQRRRGVRPSRPTLAQLWSGRG